MIKLLYFNMFHGNIINKNLSCAAVGLTILNRTTMTANHQYGKSNINGSLIFISYFHHNASLLDEINVRMGTAKADLTTQLEGKNIVKDDGINDAIVIDDGLVKDDAIVRVDKDNANTSYNYLSKN